MLAYTVYSEAGGVGKTTLAANLAIADARAGRDVLVIDMDPQEGSLSYLLDVPYDRTDGQVDNIVRHLIGKPKGPLEDLVHRVEFGVDVVPSHHMLERLPQFMIRAEQDARDLNESFNPSEQLFHVLRNAGIHEDYDTLIVDPQATAGPGLYNSIAATRNLMIPVELSGKGQRAVDGLEDMVLNLENELDIEVGVLAVVPNDCKMTGDQRDMLAEIEERGFDVPVVIGDRTSLVEGCWRQQCSIWTYIQKHRDRKRDYEVETLDQFETLAQHLREQAGAVESEREVAP